MVEDVLKKRLIFFKKGGRIVLGEFVTFLTNPLLR